MPLYFAYGSNIDEAAMAQRCPGSRPLGVARLPRHRFVITTDGYASIVRDLRADVHGLLWDLSLADVPALDRYENVSGGLYAKILQPVISAAGPRRAIVYVGKTASGGRPRSDYLLPVIEAARRWQLPQAYIAELARFLPPGHALSTPEPAAQTDLSARSGPAAKVRPRAHSPSSTVMARPRASKTDGVL
jgi:hypothetical protein